MSQDNTVKWGQWEFFVNTPDTTWKEVGGVYIFTGLNEDDRWEAMYIGETESFPNRLSIHPRWDEAQQLGATHIHATVVEQEARRELIEASLIRAYQPPLNDQLK